MNFSQTKSQRTKAQSLRRGTSKLNQDNQDFLQNVYAQIPAKDKTLSNQMYVSQSPVTSTNSKMPYGTQSIPRRQSLLTKDGAGSTPGSHKDQQPSAQKTNSISIFDKNIINSISELKNSIRDEDYTNMCGTGMSRQQQIPHESLTEKDLSQSFDIQIQNQICRDSKAITTTKQQVRIVSPVIAITTRKPSQRVIISSHNSKRDISTGSSRTVSKLRQKQSQQPMRAPSSPNLITANTTEHQFFTKQDFHISSKIRENPHNIQLVHTMIQSCDVQDSGSEECRKRSVKKFQDVNLLPEIANESKVLLADNLSSKSMLRPQEHNNALRASVVFQLQNQNLGQEAVLVVDSQDGVDSQQQDVIQRMSRGLSRQKVLSPLQHRPLVQPIADHQETATIKAMDNPVKHGSQQSTYQINSPGLKQMSIKLKPINSSSQVKQQSDLQTIEYQTDTKQSQLSKIEDREEFEKSSSPTKTIVRNPLQQTIQNWENYGYQAIYCQSQQAEPFIRRAVQKMGWVEVTQLQTSKPGGGFHIRFNISDLEGSAVDLHPRHFYNHHPSNREITTKAGLCKNLWQGCFDEYLSKVQTFFPRCYDLADLKQCNDFFNDFNQTACLSVIRIMATHFLDKNRGLDSMHREYREMTRKFQCPTVFKQKFKQRFASMDSQANLTSTKVFGGKEILRNAYYFAKGYLQSHQFQDLSVKQTKKPHKQSKQPNEEQLPALIEYHRSLVEKGVQNIQLKTYEQFKILKVFRDLQDLLPQFRDIDGHHNMWIVKPSYNARGVGIYCSRDIAEILPDKRVQQKIVQKYIESPLLLNYQGMTKRKFDFRQWVLVLSWEPLDVLVFDSCYLKICGSEFDLKQYEDILRHLSNYSLQQKGADKKELAMSSLEFEQYMSSVMKSKFSWKDDMLPKINSVIWRSLKSLQETQETRNNTFEIYGFDIVLDTQTNLQPWVIEINLSPACAERAEWLVKMLDDSAMDLLNYLQNKILVTQGAEHWAPSMREKVKIAKSCLKEVKGGHHLNQEKWYEEMGIKHRWVRLAESIEELRVFQNIMQQQMQMQMPQLPDLQLIITKPDLKLEKRIDRQYKTDQSAVVIQSLFRGHQARALARSIRRFNATIVFQRHGRMFLAKLELKRLRRERAIIKIQRWSRICLAKQELRYLKSVDQFKRKKRAVVRIQSFFRRLKAVKLCRKIKTINAATLVQAVMRAYKVRNAVRLVRTHKCLVVRIQRFYKRRFRARKLSCVLIQTHLKKYLTFTKVKIQLRYMRAFGKANKVRRHLIFSQCLLQLKAHKASIKLQTHLRRYLALKQLQKLRQNKAHLQMTQLARKLKTKSIIPVLRDLKLKWLQKVTLIQRFLRGYKANRKVTKMREEYLKNLENRRIRAIQDHAAIVIQKQLRRQLAQKKVEWLKIQDGAASMIQAMFRGFKERQKYLVVLKSLKVVDTDQQSRMSKHTATPQNNNRGDRNNAAVRKNSIAGGGQNTERSDSKFISKKQSRSLNKPVATPVTQQVQQKQSHSNLMVDLEKQKELKRQAIRHAQAVLSQMESRTGEIWSQFNKKKKELKGKFTNRDKSRDLSRLKDQVVEDERPGAASVVERTPVTSSLPVTGGYSIMPPGVSHSAATPAQQEHRKFRSNRPTPTLQHQPYEDQAEAEKRLLAADYTTQQAQQYYNRSTVRKENKFTNPQKAKSVVRTTELNFDGSTKIEDLSQTFQKPTKSPILAIVEKSTPGPVKPKIVGQPKMMNVSQPLVAATTPKKPHFPINTYSQNLQEMLHHQQPMPPPGSSDQTDNNRQSIQRSEPVQKVPTSNAGERPNGSSVLKDKLTSYLLSAGSSSTNVQAQNQGQIVAQSKSIESQEHQLRESYYKASKVFKGRAEQVLGQIKAVNQERAKDIKKSYNQNNGAAAMKIPPEKIAFM